MITGPTGCCRTISRSELARTRRRGESGRARATPRRSRCCATASSGLEVYVLRRVATMAFASGMHVFPGGTVDPRDLDHDTGWVGPPPSAWAARFGVDEARARGLVLAAVRETFEESGVLLAGAAAGPRSDPAGGRRHERRRLGGRPAGADRPDARRSRRCSSGAVSSCGPTCCAAWARWITPEFEPRRYDTAFFVAAVPTGQRTRDVGGEADRVAWVRPRPRSRAGRRRRAHAAADRGGARRAGRARLASTTCCARPTTATITTIMPQAGARRRGARRRAARRAGVRPMTPGPAGRSPSGRPACSRRTRDR